MTRQRIALIAIAMAMGIVAMAQPARAVLDKVAATIGNASGAQATFTITGEDFGTASGTIAVKGSKFCTDTPNAKVWFDGKTQWTLLKRSNEVNINTPTEAELQSMNPYNFINIYRSGYALSMTSSGQSHVVRLKASDSSRPIQEMEITVNKKTNVPSRIRVRQGSRWSDIVVKDFKKATLADATFRYDAKQYPDAEVIDLR